MTAGCHVPHTAAADGEERLVALADVLIPPDPGVGGADAGLARYINSRWGNCQPSLVDGLDHLDAEAWSRTGRPLLALDVAEIAELITDLEHEESRIIWPAGTSAREFVARLIDLAHEGFYAGTDRATEPAGWTLLDYHPLG